MRDKAKRLHPKVLAGKPEFATLVIFLVMFVLTAVLQANFFSAQVLRSYINSFTPLILLAMGQAVVIIAGGLDLSCGSSMALLLCMMTQIMDKETPVSGVWAILAALGASLVIGLVNGWAVGTLRLPAVIATFATSYVWLGAALFITPTPSGEIVPWFRVFYDFGAVGGTPAFLKGVPPAVLLILLVCALWFVLSRTRTGRYLYAVGSNDDNAYANGINTARIQTVAYTFNALCTFVCALYFAGQNGAGSARIGDPLTLQAIAAAVVGGVAMAGGKGSAYMAIVGAVIMSLVSKLIFFANIPNAFQTLVSGLIIIAAIASSAVYTHRRRRLVLKGEA